MRDYKVIFKLLFSGAIMGLGAASFFYVSAFIFPTVMTAIQSGVQYEIWSSIGYTLAATCSSALVSLIGYAYYDAAREGTITRIRTRLVENLAEKMPMLQSEKDFQDVLRDVLEQVVSSIPVVVHLIVIFLIEVPIALAYLNVQLLTVTCVLAYFNSKIGSYIKSKLKEKSESASEKRDEWQLAVNHNLKNADTLYNLSKENDFRDLVTSQFAESESRTLSQQFALRVQAIFTSLAHKASIICYSIYFSVGLYLGTITIPMIMMLMPICDEISKLMTKTISGGGRSKGNLTVNVKKLLGQWNLFSNQNDQIDVKQDTRLYGTQIRAFGFLSLGMSVMGYIFAPAVIFKAMVAVPLLIYMLSYSSSDFGWAARVIIKWSAAFVCIKHGCNDQPVIQQVQSNYEPVSGTVLSGAVLIPGQETAQKIAKDFQMRLGEVNWCQAPNGTGKSTIFAGVVSGKNPNTKPFFQSHQSWVIRGDCQNLILSSKKCTVLQELQNRFSITQEGAQGFERLLRENLDSIGILNNLEKSLDLPVGDRKYSDGERQSLVCSGLLAALELNTGEVSKVKYVCLDELLSKMDPQRRQAAVELINDKGSAWCQSSGGTIVMIEQTADRFREGLYAARHEPVPENVCFIR
jgi:ABC-type hemin transport system ATPase subunit